MQNFKQRVLVAGLGLFVAMGGFTGCSYLNAKKARETGRTTTQVADDEATTDRVQDALKNNPIYKFPAVAVQTFDGTVQLSGFVNTESQKHEATQMAQNVPGVRRVLNNIAVQAPMPEARGAAGNGQLYNYGQGGAGQVNHAPIYTPGNQGQGQQPNNQNQPANNTPNQQQ
jgi:hyperosmotically inducible periplasmic protein